MKRILVLPALILAGCSGQHSSEYDATSISAEVRTTLEGYANAVNIGDFEAAGSFYSDRAEFYWIERGRQQYENAAAARNSLASLKDSRIEVSISFSEMHISPLGPNSAIASTRFTTSFEAAESDGFTFEGWLTTGLVRQKNGWKIAGGHTEELPLIAEQ